MLHEGEPQEAVMGQTGSLSVGVEVLVAAGAIVYWALIVWAATLVTAAVVRRRRARAQAVPDREALLETWLARGEIDRAEYRARMAVVANATSLPARRPHEARRTGAAGGRGPGRG
jgi:uncharacterized membrane protein